jgi:hypothetical protein
MEDSEDSKGKYSTIIPSFLVSLLKEGKKRFEKEKNKTENGSRQAIHKRLRTNKKGKRLRGTWELSCKRLRLFHLVAFFADN